MRKLFVLAYKELWLTLRDVGSLALMIATPFALTLAIAAAFGGDNDVAVADLPILVLNQDEGEMGALLVAMLQPEMSNNMLKPQIVQEADLARRQVDADTAVALVTIPANFSQLLLTADTPIEPAVVQIYASPARPIGTLVVRTIVEQFLDHASLTTNVSQALIRELMTHAHDADELDYPAIAQSWPDRLDELTATSIIHLEITVSTGQPFNWLNYFAPSLAMLFLLFSATGGGRTFITEKESGTLPRLLISPTPSFVILIGKMTGTIITGLVQMGFLWMATSLIGAYWGPIGIVALSLFVLVICASGLGAIIATWTQNTAQANIISAGVVMIASVLSGNFYPRMNLPDWVQSISLITPNGWGIELFLDLQSGADMQEIWPLIAGMIGLTVIYYLIAAVGFRRQYA